MKKKKKIGRIKGPGFKNRKLKIRSWKSVSNRKHVVQTRNKLSHHQPNWLINFFFFIISRFSFVLGVTSDSFRFLQLRFIKQATTIFTPQNFHQYFVFFSKIGDEDKKNWRWKKKLEPSFRNIGDSKMKKKNLD